MTEIPRTIYQNTEGWCSHRIEINQKSDSLLAPLKLTSSYISSSPSICHPDKFPGSFDRQLFCILVQNISLCNRQMSLWGEKCWGNLPGWHQNWVFSDMRIEEMGTSSDFWLISILWCSAGLQNVRSNVLREGHWTLFIL